MSASGRTDFRLLGSVEVVVDGRAVPLGGAKQRALLAVLLLHANEAVSRDFLIDQLWGERAPVSADHAIAVYVSRLRKVLEAHGAEETLRPVPGGYLLRIDAEQTDVGRFERALDEGRRALEAAPWDAAAILRRALAQWRGEALSDVVFEPFATTEARRLEELRLTALETRIDADLAVGRHAELIGELRSLVDRHPLNERFRAQLMLALYRAGRQAGALEVYRKTRRFLLDELGLEPGTDLQRLEQAILRHDPELEAPTVTSPVRSAAPPRRRTVSVLFAAVSSSTPPGEQLDPESLHLVTARCFNAIQETIERHGGWMERYAGDALIGIFGVPALHEDDALRAVRAATDMRDALVSLNEELRRDRGTALELRVAVNTGRVLTGAEGSAVTGDAVNVAVGLGQLARAGEILIGEETLRLVWNAVRVEPVEPCSLEGRAEPVTAHRLIATAAGARAAGGRAAGRLAEVAMVGRHRQLERMRDTFARVVQERSCHLFTIVGAAGIGKSRLAAEFLASLSDVTVLSGRCLAYGEGVAYVPVVDVLRQLPDVTELALDDVSVAALGSLLGERQVATTPPEIADGVRKALQAVASEQPVVVLFDDIHCGEGPFLDLVEHVAEVSSDAPILLLCLARPELLERRPNWTGGALNATALLLESLSEEEAGALIGSLLGGTRLEREVLDEIRQWTQGNPLFIEEMVALAVASDDPGVTIPPTVEAVLAAHLDQIDPEEREVLEAGAVEGQLFHVSAIRALVPRATHVAARLDALVRKDLVRPAKPQLPGEEAFRFRHLLIRDTAYRALPKARRADLHELFSDWLDVHAADVVVVAELGGYHLEQAYRYRRELSPSDERVTALATRAAERLALAGRRAHRLGDVGATADLLRRARALCAVAPAALEVEFADALLWAGHPAEAEEVLDEAEARAAGKGNRSAELLVRLVRTAISWGVNPEGKSLELSQLAEEAVPVFEAEGCESGLMRAWIALGQCEHMHGRFEACNRAYGHALVHAHRAGDWRSVADITTRIGVGYMFGPEPVDEGLRWLGAQEAQLRGQPVLIGLRAMLEATRGRFREARALLAEARARNQELGARGVEALQAEAAWIVESYADDHGAAEQAIRAGCRLLEETGASGFLATQAAELACTLCALENDEEAEEWARRSAALAASDDVWTQMLWRQALARVAARRGQLAEAERLAREAVALGGETDLLTAVGDALTVLAAVLRLAGRQREAAAQAKRALGLYERKGNTVMAAQARRISDPVKLHLAPQSPVGAETSEPR